MSDLVKKIIQRSIENSELVILFWLIVAVAGLVSARNINLDVIPDLSETQVIVHTQFPGQGPRIIEDQVTFPITRKLLSIPEATAVRGFSQFNDSYVYVIFSDDVNGQFARTRVLEYLSQLQRELPEGVQPVLGPDASAVGWVYEYALASTSKNLAELRSMQDWFLKPELQAVPGVAEVATVGGMVKQYQIVIDPEKQRQRNIPLSLITQAVKNGSGAIGGSVMELAEAEYAIHFSGYLKNLEDIRNISLDLDRSTGTPIFLRDIADVRLGPKMRRGIADLNGEGEVVGGVVVMQTDANALNVVESVKAKIQSLAMSLPDDVDIIPTYDRSKVIHSAVNNLGFKLLLEILVIALVCYLFLGQVSSSLVVLLSLPVGILTAIGLMHWQGLTMNIMSLGGIVITVGAMVDAAVVMTENVSERLSQRQKDAGGERLSISQSRKAVYSASIEVGPALFISLLIITLSFVPLLALNEQAGRLFHPMVYTKTYAMAAAAALSITLLPVILYIVRGNQATETKATKLITVLESFYRKVLNAAFKRPWQVFMLASVIALSSIYPAVRSGTEFMPRFDEGDILYMPTTLPGVSIAKAREILVLTDRLIQSVPEVESTFGKAGRANSATDPAPLSMLETTIILKPREQWRAGMTKKKIIQELDQLVKIPGLVNAWVQPIKTRIDMLSTGIRTPLGIIVTGPDSEKLQQLGLQIETALRSVNKDVSVISDRSYSGRYLKIEPDRNALSRFGVSIEEVNHTIQYAIGGATIDFTVEGAERYPINLRYPQHRRDSISKLEQIPLISKSGLQLRLGDVCRLYFTEAEAVIKTENSRPAVRVLIDPRGVSSSDFLQAAVPVINEKIQLPPGYSINWGGEFEHLQNTYEQLSIIIPLTVLVIGVLLTFIFSNLIIAMIPLLALPFALSGGLWFVWWHDLDLSIATAAGFIALAGVAVEFSVVMLIYLENAFRRQQQLSTGGSNLTIEHAVILGAVRRVRPKIMTVVILLAGLGSVMLSSGTGTEIMKSIAAPIIGGMVTAPLVSMILVPLLYRNYLVFLLNRNERLLESFVNREKDYLTQE